MSTTIANNAAGRAQYIRDQLPPKGLFAGLDWRISPSPFRLEPEVAKELETLGRVLLQFYRALNLLYRKSADGKLAPWAAQWLDLGKPRWLIDLQRDTAFKTDVPRVIRPDLLLTDEGLSLTELDSVPGGIGLTAWLNQVYSQNGQEVIGGNSGMTDGFAGIFGDAARVHLVVSDESATYRPEMEWLAERLGSRFTVRDSHFEDFRDGDAVYRFFELFDLANVANSGRIFELARENTLFLTPPPKPVLEEKMMFALLWNRNLQSFWRQELGAAFFERLKGMTPYTWLVDPAPLPPHAAIPELNLTDWQQLKTLSQKERELVLKVSGFSEEAWGARGVYLGSDLSAPDWSVAVDKALESFDRSPYILQRFHKPSAVQAEWHDFERQEAVKMQGRARLCPYYFVHGDGSDARAHLGGVMATICPINKKIIHGMKDAIIAPCSA